jgi:2-iminobutanoate/2-iminopropanoate deaminase
MTERQVFGVDPVEPYSKVVKANGLVYVKSQIGRDPQGEYADDIETQTRWTLTNLEHLLETAGSSFDDVAKVNVYLSHIDRDFDGMNVGYDAFLRERDILQGPARTTIGTPLSWPQLLVQMDLIALAP